MPRRIIYLRNPSSGSNFRTLGGSQSTRPSRPRTSRPQTSRPQTSRQFYNNTPPGTWRAPNGAIYKLAGDWITNFDNPSFSDQSNNYSGYAPGGWDPASTGEWGVDFVPASTLLGQMYDVWIRGIDPYRGDIFPPIGTPGTHAWTNPLSGAVHMNPGTSSDNEFKFLSPKRKDPRPW